MSNLMKLQNALKTWGLVFIKNFSVVMGMFLLSGFILATPVSASSECIEFDLGICIDTSISGLSTSLFQLAAAISAAVVLMLVTMGSFKILTSGGDPNKMKDGREQITNALMGFLLILLSTTILTLVLQSMGLL